MSSSRTAGASAARRRQRSVRVTVAVSLLALAAVVVAAAVLLGSLLIVSVAAVLAVLLGAASTRIVLNELAQSRREAARDRAAQAQAYQQTFAVRIAEHDRFAATMTERIIARDGEIGELRGTIRLAERRADEAEERVKREARRTVTLQERLDEVSRELEEREDSLAVWNGVWDSGDAPTVVDLLAWEERVAAASESGDTRRHA